MKIFLIGALILLSTFANAERFEFTGEILDILATEDQSNSNAEQLMLFYVDGFRSAGDCYVAQSTGHVTLKVRNNDQGKFQASLALSAYMAGKKVLVRVSDESKDGNSYCYLQHVRLNKGY